MGMGNFLSLFCPELQKLLKLIYDLTRHSRQFILREEQQLAYRVRNVEISHKYC